MKVIRLVTIFMYVAGACAALAGAALFILIIIGIGRMLYEWIFPTDVMSSIPGWNAGLYTFVALLMATAFFSLITGLFAFLRKILQPQEK